MTEIMVLSLGGGCAIEGLWIGFVSAGLTLTISPSRHRSIAVVLAMLPGARVAMACAVDLAILPVARVVVARAITTAVVIMVAETAAMGMVRFAPMEIVIGVVNKSNTNTQHTIKSKKKKGGGVHHAARPRLEPGHGSCARGWILDPKLLGNRCGKAADE